MIYTVLGIIAVLVILCVTIYSFYQYRKKKQEPEYKKWMSQKSFTTHNYEMSRWGHSIATIRHEGMDKHGASIHSGMGFGFGVEDGHVLILHDGAILVYNIKYQGDPRDMFSFDGVSVNKEAAKRIGSPAEPSMII